MNTFESSSNMSSTNSLPSFEMYVTQMKLCESEKFNPKDADKNSAIYKLYEAFLPIHSDKIKPYQCLLHPKVKIGRQETTDREKYAERVINTIRNSMIFQQFNTCIKSNPKFTKQHTTANILHSPSKQIEDNNDTETQGQSSPKHKSSNENDSSSNGKHDAVVNSIHITIDEKEKEFPLNRNETLHLIEQQVFSFLLHVLHTDDWKMETFKPLIEHLIKSITEPIVNWNIDYFFHSQRLKKSVSNTVVEYLNTHQESFDGNSNVKEISNDCDYQLDEQFTKLLDVNGVEILTSEKEVLNPYIQTKLMPYLEPILVPISYPKYRPARKWKHYNQRIVNCLAAVLTLYRFTHCSENLDLIGKVLGKDYSLTFPYEWWVIYEFHRKFYLEGYRPTKEQIESYEAQNELVSTVPSTDSQDTEPQKAEKIAKSKIKLNPVPPSYLSPSDQEKYMDLQKEIDRFYTALNWEINETSRLIATTKVSNFLKNNSNFDVKSDQARPINCVVDVQSSRPPVFNDIRESIYTFRKARMTKEDSTRHTKEDDHFFHPIEKALIKVVLKFDIKAEPPLPDNMKKKKRK